MFNFLFGYNVLINFPSNLFFDFRRENLTLCCVVKILKFVNLVNLVNLSDRYVQRVFPFSFETWRCRFLDLSPEVSPPKVSVPVGLFFVIGCPFAVR